MKKLLAALAFAMSTAHATTPHHIYVEPDFAWNLNHTDKDAEGAFETSGQFVGLNGGYEYSPPNFLYAAFDAHLSVGTRSHKAQLPDGKKALSEYRCFQNKIEGVIGYHFETRGFSLIPFVGTGAYYVSSLKYRDTFAYLPMGLKLEYQFRTVNIGLRAEQMRYLHYWSRNGDKAISFPMNGENGFEVALPVSFKTKDAMWNVSLEPYYLNFNFSPFLGARLSAVHTF